MKQFTIREFQLHPFKCLKSAPFELLRYNTVVAIVSSPEEITQHSHRVTQHFEEPTLSKPMLRNISLNVTQHPQVEEEIIDQDEDGQLYGRCESPTCKNEGKVFEGEYKEWNYDRGEMMKRAARLCQKCFDRFDQMTE